MEDMPIGDLTRLVEHIEGSATSIADAWGLCPDCGGTEVTAPREECSAGTILNWRVVRCANCRRIRYGRPIRCA